MRLRPKNLAEYDERTTKRQVQELRHRIQVLVRSCREAATAADRWATPQEGVRAVDWPERASNAWSRSLECTAFAASVVALASLIQGRAPSTSRAAREVRAAVRSALAFEESASRCAASALEREREEIRAYETPST